LPDRDEEEFVILVSPSRQLERVISPTNGLEESARVATSRCESDGSRVDPECRAVPASVASVCSRVLYRRAASSHSRVLVIVSAGPLGPGPTGHSRSRRAPPTAPCQGGLDTGSVGGRGAASAR